MNVKLKIVIIVIFCCNFCAFSDGIQCTDEHNEIVDWFYIYKIPKIHHTDKFIKSGVAYTYITSKNQSKWQFSSRSINDTNSMVGNTLSPYYKNMSDTAYVFYNDQPPNKSPNPNKGHTKGVILADPNGGFWLIHSVPHFPQMGSEYKFSPTGIVKGQSLLCISLDLKNLNKVGVQLQYNQPQVFISYIPDILNTKIQQVVNAASGVTVTKPPWYNKLFLTSKAGLSFASFAKSEKFGKDLYEDWVAPDLQSDLYVETWPNGAGRLPSNCSKPFKVYNIENITIDVINTNFTDTKDHSKWAVGQNSAWICVGDINRMEHQKLRGGGTVCLNNKNIADTYRNCVEEVEKCNK